MRFTTALAVIAVIAAAAPAGADTRAPHTVKHRTHVARHLRVHHRPSDHPRYRYGGPLYSTCDRINADRMLVGTCR